MYPITNDVKALFEAEQRKVLRITGTDKNGATITITDNNVIEDSFQIDRYSCNGEKLEIGTAIAAQMSLTLENGSGQYNGIVFEGAELFVEVGTADWTQSSPTITYIPCGYFTPDEQPRRLSTINITALDRMTKFDVVVEATDLTFQTTIAGLVGQVCTLCGVTLAQSISGLVNAGVTVTELPTAQDEITYRNLIQWCAGIMGTNAWLDWNGQLRFSWYANSTGYVSTVDNRYSSDLYENDLTVSGVEYTNNSGIVIVDGTDDYAIDLTGNAIAGPLVATVLPPLNTALNGFTYRPFTAATVNAPYLWPMDIVTFTDKDGNDHTSALTNVAFGLNGTTALEAKGMTYAINKAAQPKGFTKEQAQLVNQAMDQVETNIDESLTQQEIFNRLTDNGAAQGLVLYNGQLYVNASYIQSGTLTLGGLNNVNGRLRVLNAAGDEVGKWDNYGLEVKEGAFNATAPGGYVAINAEVVPAIRRAFGILWSPSTGDDVLVSIDRGELSITAGGFDGYFIDDGHTNITPGEININGGIYNSYPGIIINGNADYSGGLSAESTTLYRNGQIRFTDYNGNTYFNLDYLTGMTLQAAITASGGFFGNVTGNCSGSAGSVAWGNVSGKPSEYTPASGSSYYVKYHGNLTSLGSGTPAAATKTYWTNNVGNGKVEAAYNNAGDEYSILFGRGSATYGSILKFGYPNRYMWILRMKNNSWQSDDWEKIYAGYADSAGSATTASSCSGNAASATQLQTARSLWGNSFNGTADISGDIAMAQGSRIHANQGALYIGNSGNQSWVYFQDMASQDSSKWKIHQNGNAEFNGTVTAGGLSLSNALAVGDGGTGSTSASGARTNLGITSGTKTATFSNGKAVLSFSDFGVSSRPNVLMLTAQDDSSAFYKYDYGDSTSNIVIRAYQPNGTAVANGSHRFCYICIP